MRHRQSGTELGQLAEAYVEHWLKRQGLAAVARNYRCRRGEIDLVMLDGDTLVFVEVRLRTHKGFGGAEASVDRAKRRRLSAAATHFLASRPALSNAPCRFDVIAVTAAPDHRDFNCNWIRNAFYAWE